MDFQDFLLKATAVKSAYLSSRAPKHKFRLQSIQLLSTYIPNSRIKTWIIVFDRPLIISFPLNEDQQNNILPFRVQETTSFISIVTISPQFHQSRFFFSNFNRKWCHTTYTEVELPIKIFLFFSDPHTHSHTFCHKTRNTKNYFMCHMTFTSTTHTTFK